MTARDPNAKYGPDVSVLPGQKLDYKVEYEHEVAVDDTATTNEDVAVIINILGNDSDVEGDTLSVSFVAEAANGTVTNNGKDLPSGVSVAQR